MDNFNIQINQLSSLSLPINIKKIQFSALCIDTDKKVYGHYTIKQVEYDDDRWEDAHFINDEKNDYMIQYEIDINTLMIERIE